MSIYAWWNNLGSNDSQFEASVFHFDKGFCVVYTIMIHHSIVGKKSHGSDTVLLYYYLGKDQND